MFALQVWNDWEIQLLVLLSFSLQIFLFFFGGFRPRSGHMLLRFPLWLSYLLADFVAVYALGYLSRHIVTSTDSGESQASSSQSHKFMFFWTPFLLIHLGGQDSVTAFSIEDNELWLRHLLNLLVQVYLALYVFWNSMAHNQLVVPAIFVFVGGIIKYGERTWALKCGSQKALRSSTSNEVVDQLPELKDEPGLQYSTIVKHALCAERGVRDVFAGRTFYQMKDSTQIKFSYDHRRFEGDGQVDFKIVEIELGMMYDELYTKAKVIRTWPGTILRGVSFISTVIAFVLFITIGGKQRYNYGRVDVAITYALFIGAFFLEACAICSVMMSPRTWAFLEGRQYHRLAHVAWSIFTSARPKTRPWWSNSMGQYNFLSSCISDKSRMSTLITKIMNLIGAKEIWSKIRHTNRAQVTMEIKKLINQSFFYRIDRGPWIEPLNPYLIPASKEILNFPFEEALLLLHIFTDFFLYKGLSMTEVDITEEMQRLVDTCKGISDYMFYLLVMHPAMLPVGSNVQDLLAEASEKVRASSASSKEQFLEALAATEGAADPYGLTGSLFGEAQRLLQEGQDFRAALQVLVSVWVRLLVYAAGSSRAEEHARRLSMGGELLTFVWLLLAHRELGNTGAVVDLRPKDPREQTTVSTRGPSGMGKAFVFRF